MNLVSKQKQIEIFEKYFSKVSYTDGSEIEKMFDEYERVMVSKTEHGVLSKNFLLEKIGFIEKDILSNERHNYKIEDLHLATKEFLKREIEKMFDEYERVIISKTEHGVLSKNFLLEKIGFIEKDLLSNERHNYKIEDLHLATKEFLKQ